MLGPAPCGPVGYWAGYFTAAGAQPPHSAYVTRTPLGALCDAV